jgi:hypothetical protein
MEKLQQPHWPPAQYVVPSGDASARRGAIASVDLTAHQRDGALIHRSGIPGLDGCEIGFAGLISRASAPTVALRKFAVELSALARRAE